MANNEFDHPFANIRIKELPGIFNFFGRKIKRLIQFFVFVIVVLFLYMFPRQTPEEIAAQNAEPATHKSQKIFDEYKAKHAKIYWVKENSISRASKIFGNTETGKYFVEAVEHPGLTVEYAPVWGIRMALHNGDLSVDPDGVYTLLRDKSGNEFVVSSEGLVDDPRSLQWWHDSVTGDRLSSGVMRCANLDCEDNWSDRTKNAVWWELPPQESRDAYVTKMTNAIIAAYHINMPDNMEYAQIKNVLYDYQEKR